MNIFALFQRLYNFRSYNPTHEFKNERWREREFNFNIMTLLIVTWLPYADAVSSNKHRFKYNF